MKLVFKIAKTELLNLFYSPVAWFLTFIFMIVCGIFYSAPVEKLATIQDTLLAASPGFNGLPMSLTASLIMSSSGSSLIQNIFSNLYLFIPLLTMGLISREFNSGTFKLLYSSPVKVSQIVWGKYLAIMVYNMILSLIMILFMIVAAYSIKSADIGHMVVGVIAFYLVVCAYTAIGMFMSSLTNYQVLSAVATFILLFALQWMGLLWQDYDFVRDLTYFISINGRAERMISGLLASRDVMYYALVAYLFVMFSYLSLKHGRENVSIAKKVLRYCSVFVIVLIIGYVSSRPGYVAYWDGTANKVNTIKEPTQEIIKGFDNNEPIEVTLYTNLLDPGKGYSKTRPSERNTFIWGIWDPYIRFHANIKFNYVLYYNVADNDSSIYHRFPGLTLDSIAMELAKIYEANYNDYLKPAEIKQIIDLDAEDWRSIMLIKYKGKSQFLRMYEDAMYWPFEQHFAAVFKRLTTDTIPKMYSSTGHFERSIHKLGEREYSFHTIYKGSRDALINNGFEVDTLNLTTQDIPADAHSFVLGDPKVELSEVVRTKLRKYIETGGNMLVVSEPGKQDIINPVIQQTGVQLQPGTLVQLSAHETPDKITPFMTMDYTWQIGANTPRMKSVRADYANGDSVKVMHPGVAPLAIADSGFNIHRMWVTGPSGLVWVKKGHLVTDSAPPVLEPKLGDYQLDSFSVAVALERKVNSKHQKLVVVGDADFLSNGRGGSTFTGLDYLSWMSNESYPIRLFQKPVKDNLLNINTNTAELQKLILVWILPGVVLVIGVLLLMRRKRQ